MKGEKRSYLVLAFTLTVIVFLHVEKIKKHKILLANGHGVESRQMTTDIKPSIFVMRSK